MGPRLDPCLLLPRKIFTFLPVLECSSTWLSVADESTSDLLDTTIRSQSMASLSSYTGDISVQMLTVAERTQYRFAPEVASTDNGSTKY